MDIRVIIDIMDIIDIMVIVVITFYTHPSFLLFSTTDEFSEGLFFQIFIKKIKQIYSALGSVMGHELLLFKLFD